MSGELGGVAQADPLLTHPGLRVATGRVRRLADPHTLRPNERIAQMRSSRQAGARPGPLHHGPHDTMRSQSVPDRGPSHHHRQGHGRAGGYHARRCQTAPPRDHQDSR